MERGVGIRLLLISLAIGVGLLVLFLALSGAEDALREVAPALERTQREVILDSLYTTQFTRGLIGLIVAALLAAAIGRACERLFRAARIRSVGAAPRYWLQEARDAADATARAAAEAADRLGLLDRQRGDLNRLLESVSEGILQLDSDGRVVRANRAARRLLSLPDDVEGQPIGAVVRSAELRTLLQRATAEDALPPREVPLEDATLVVTARRLNSTGRPARSDAAGLAVAIADLTAIRKLEAVRRDFVANASHELKTPLTSIRGYAETLGDESLPADMRRQFIATISSNAERLQHIVDDLLDLSRLESGTWRPVLSPVAPRDAVTEAWNDFAERATKQKVGFDFAVDTQHQVSADPSALRQVISNLFDNALRHTAPGGRIDVRVVDWSLPADGYARNRRREHVAFEIRDTGTGIPVDALSRIFERFYRVDPARSRAEGGTGLGLSIVKHLTESMGGSAQAESQLGVGTTIRVILPAADTGGGGAAAAAP